MRFFCRRFLFIFPWILIVLYIGTDIKPSVMYLSLMENVQQQQQQHQYNASPPVIYAITPTFSRAVQKAELTRLSNTFRLVPYFHWIVVEDSSSRSKLVSRLLVRSGLRYTHLNMSTPQVFKGKGLPRGTEQRNAALIWLRRHRTSRDKGVIYFADDDNSYSLELFEEMRSTRTVAVWPVGLVGRWGYERPLVENGKVVGWYSSWIGGRKFATDMAGFAVNLQVILSKPHALFKRFGAVPGMQEPEFLNQITNVEDLEPKARNCTKVLVWHTRTQNVIIEKKQNDSNYFSVEV